MAQLNITLNQDEILQLLSENRDQAFRDLLTACLNNVLKAESAAQLGAEPYERTEERTDSRNGTRERPLTTRIGKIILTVPRHRDQPFKTLVFDNYTRSEAALIASMAEMVVAGVSTRKVSDVMETLCGKSFSRSTVSEVCKTLDDDVKTFKERTLTKEYPFVMVDATYFKVREDHRVKSKALMIALATDLSGNREILGFDVYDNESNGTWKSFFESLKTRGLHGVRMITSDAHDGILYGISETYPEVPWQRCQTHFSRNIIDKAPKQYQTAIHDALNDMYNSNTIEDARKKRDDIISEYGDIAEKAMQCLDEGFESIMTVMVLPESMRIYFRTSNHLERLNKELKRRSKVIGIFPNAESLNRLMGSVIIDQNDRYSARRSVNCRKGDFNELYKLVQELKLIADEQHKMLKAA